LLSWCQVEGGGEEEAMTSCVSRASYDLLLYVLIARESVYLIYNLLYYLNNRKQLAQLTHFLDWSCEASSFEQHGVLYDQAAIA